jgi:hypothetical protein
MAVVEVRLENKGRMPVSEESDYQLVGLHEVGSMMHFA